MGRPGTGEDGMKRAARALLTASALAFAGLLGPTMAQPPGQVTAYRAVACDRACLAGQLHAYMDALTHHDPKRASFTKDVTFTENDVALPIGAGLWGTISGAASEGLEAADPSTGQA